MRWTFFKNAEYTAATTAHSCVDSSFFIELILDFCQLRIFIEDRCFEVVYQ